MVTTEVLITKLQAELDDLDAQLKALASGKGKTGEKPALVQLAELITRSQELFGKLDQARATQRKAKEVEEGVARWVDMAESICVGIRLQRRAEHLAKLGVKMVSELSDEIGDLANLLGRQADEVARETGDEAIQELYNNAYDEINALLKSAREGRIPTQLVPPGTIIEEPVAQS